MDIGGYDADFVDEEIPTRLECPVCLLAFRQPHLLNCCGKKVCESCLGGIRVQKCPLCRKDFKSMPDQHLAKEVLSLKVYCSNKSKGCKWIGGLGELQGHSGDEGTCQYIPVPCPNECGAMVPRKLMDQHSLEDCPNKPAGGADFAMLKEVYKAQLEEVKTEMEEQKKELLARMDTIGSTLDNTKGEVEEQKHKVATLEGSLAEKDAIVASLRQELTQCKEDIALLKEGNAVSGDKPVTFTVHSGGFESGNCAKFFINGVRVPHQSGRGINVVVLHPISYKCIASKRFDTHDNESTSHDLQSFISSQESGFVVGMAVMDDGSRRLSDVGKAIIDQIGGDQIYYLNHRHSYAVVAIMGCPDYTLQVSSKNAASIASYLLPVGGTGPIVNGEQCCVKATSCGSAHGESFAAVAACRSSTPYKVHPLNNGKRGIYLGLVNPSIQGITAKMYDTHSLERDSNSLSNTLIAKDIRSDNIVAMAVNDTATSKMTETLHYTLDAYGSSRHGDMQHKGSWVLIGRWGHEHQTVELVHRSAKLAVAATYSVN